MNTPETFRCRIYQPGNSGPWTRAEIEASIIDCGRLWVTLEVNYPEEYAERVVVGPVDPDSRKPLLDRMVREGVLKRVERVIECPAREGTGFMDCPAHTKRIAEYTRA